MTGIQKELTLRQLGLAAAPLLILKPRLILEQGGFIQFILNALKLSGFIIDLLLRSSGKNRKLGLFLLTVIYVFRACLTAELIYQKNISKI